MSADGDLLACDLLIIGAGPVGLFAAYYAGFRGWSSVGDGHPARARAAR